MPKNYNYLKISDQLTGLMTPRDAPYTIECLQIGFVACALMVGTDGSETINFRRWTQQ
jgi:hypothetical protein